MTNDPFDTILESIEQMNLSYCQLSYTIFKTYLNIYDPICRFYKTVLYVQIDNVKPAYIFVTFLTLTINIILDVLFAITNYQLLYMY